jgi:uracil-DNA glycosylase
LNIFDDIRRDIENDPFNAVYKERGIGPVFSANKNARIAIIGQAPGKKVEETNLFWNDQSGDRLREWMGIDRETFYSTDLIAQIPMDFYYPGKGKTGDLPPRKGFAEKFHPRLLNEMPQLATIVLIGNYAQKYYLGKRRQSNLTETVRHYQDYLPKYFPLVHPSPLNRRWLQKNPWFEEDVVPVFRTMIQDYLTENRE